MRLSSLSNGSLELVYGLERSKKKFNLESVTKMLALLRHPEKSYLIIHVAGTNGKGSVCCMMASALQETRLNVGLYTSPHLIRIHERFRVNGKEISSAALDRIAARVSSLAKARRIPLSFFETLTIIALLYFKEQDVDYAVLETGMGGRLDATNAVLPDLTVITNISKDHCEVLGSTIRKIALEKAGIIKKGIPLITGAKGSSLKIIKGVCRQQQAQCIIAKKKNVSLWTDAEYEKENAGTAFAALKCLGIPEKKIAKGLEKSYWSGRFESVSKDILVDCAHNPGGMRALVKSLQKMKKGKSQRWIVILGMMGDKDAKSIAGEIRRIPCTFILTKADMTRALDPCLLAKYFRNAEVTHSLRVTHSLKEAFECAKRIRKKKEKILVTGSIFLVGEALSLLKENS